MVLRHDKRHRAAGDTTLPSDRSDKPLDLVNRQFIATKPNQLWVADITYVAT